LDTTLHDGKLERQSKLYLEEKCFKIKSLKVTFSRIKYSHVIKKREKQDKVIISCQNEKV
jgi:hypothetical protein